MARIKSGIDLLKFHCIYTNLYENYKWALYIWALTWAEEFLVN